MLNRIDDLGLDGKASAFKNGVKFEPKRSLNFEHESYKPTMSVSKCSYTGKGNMMDTTSLRNNRGHKKKPKLSLSKDFVSRNREMAGQRKVF